MYSMASLQLFKSSSWIRKYLRKANRILKDVFLSSLILLCSPFMPLVFLCQANGMALVVGLPAHLDGSLYVKRQVLVCLECEGGAEGQIMLSKFAIKSTYCHKFIQLIYVLELGVAIEKKGSVVCIGLTFLMERLEGKVGIIRKKHATSTVEPLP